MDRNPPRYQPTLPAKKLLRALLFGAVLIVPLLAILPEASAQGPRTGADSTSLDQIHHLQFGSGSDPTDDCAYAQLHEGPVYAAAPYVMDMRLTYCDSNAAFTLIQNDDTAEHQYPNSESNTAPDVRLAFTDLDQSGGYTLGDGVYLTTGPAPMLDPTTSFWSFTLRLSETFGYAGGQWVTSQDDDFEAYKSNAIGTPGSWAWHDWDGSNSLTQSDSVYVLPGRAAGYPAGSVIPADAVRLKSTVGPQASPTATYTGTSAYTPAPSTTYPYTSTPPPRPTPTPTYTGAPSGSASSSSTPVLDCNQGSEVPADGYFATLDAPDVNYLGDGYLMIYGRTDPSGPASAPPENVRADVYARLGTNDIFVGTAPYTGGWSLYFNVSGLHDGEYAFWARVRYDNGNSISNVICYDLETGNPVFFEDADHWVDPAQPGANQHLTLFVRFTGRSDHAFQVAEVAQFIDNQERARFLVSVQQPAPGEFMLGDGLDLPGGVSAGFHDHRVEIVFDPSTNHAYAFSSQVVQFMAGPYTTYGSTQTATPSAVFTGTPPTMSAAPTTAPGPEFRVEPGAIALDRSTPQRGETSTVFVRVLNQGSGNADGSVAIAILDPQGNVEWDGRLPVRIHGHDEEIVSTAWVPSQEGSYAIHASLQEDPALGAFVAATSEAHSTARSFHVGPSPSPHATLVITSGLLNIGSIAEGSTRTIPVEVTAYGSDAPAVELDVFEDAGIDVEVVTPPTLVPAGQTVKFHLRVSVPSSAGNTSYELRVRAANVDSSSNLESMDLVAHPVGFHGLPFFGTVGTIAAVSAAGGATAFFRRRH